ncbi:MAG TPA: alpha-amylase family glycosyl hydrolase [Nitrospira sp.]|nr:alpha-amylase family glycosyl hydrolase [Nitrospira sp.]
MSGWPSHPLIYEINTWAWLHELGDKKRRPITLGHVPSEVWDTVASYGFDAVWLMGVWAHSPTGLAISMQNEGLLTEFRRTLPDFVPEDNVGSAYCVKDYRVDQTLGGPEGLAQARKHLAERGMRLILDFVPNHVAPDHSWATGHPDYFIRGSATDLSDRPGEFLRVGDHVLACGRDPYFPPWQDVLQLNAFSPDLRKAAIETVLSIADQCDGMRCDMAMLLLNHVFERTWGPRAGPKPQTEYWREVITVVKQRHPQLLFMAEAYWDLEWELQQQGFDFCYDKRLYDRLEHDNAEQIRLHLCAEASYQRRLVRFIENHDEPRAATTFSPPQARAAALTVSTLPGAVLFHDGQFEGRRIKVPVFLRRRPKEPVDRSLVEFYDKLLGVLRHDTFRDGQWQLCERTGWPDNQSHLNLVAWCWTYEDRRHLVVVNLSDRPSQGRVRIPAQEDEGALRLSDELSGAVYERHAGEIRDMGLYVDLQPWAYHVLRF